MKEYLLKVEEDLENERIDRYVTSVLADLSRSYIQKLIEHIEKTGGRNAANVTVVGNGCVHDIASFKALCSIAPKMDGIMIGRTAVQKPWIFAELSNIFLSKSEKWG